MTRFDAYAPWDVVAIPYPYTDRLAEKRRPALVVSQPHVQTEHGLIWVVMITSAENAPWKGDISVKNLKSAGLPAPSVVRTAKLAVMDSARVAKRLGALDRSARVDVATRLRENLAQ